MSKIRVYELAKELNVSSKDLITLLMEEFGVEVKNHMSVIEDEDAALIQELIGENGIPQEKKSIVDEYEDQLAEEVNKGVRKKKKTKKEIEREEIERNAIFFGKSDTTKTKFGATLYRHGGKESSEETGWI